ncbi:nucleotide-binding alpha-beta plait domain-containing protein [Tanacetum coccineum]
MLGPKPPNANVVRSVWLFRHKYYANGSLSSLVVEPATIQTVFSLAMSRGWPVHHLDVKNSFLNGDLLEIVYMYQPLSFVDPRFLHHGSLKRAHMVSCNPSLTPVDTESKLGPDWDRQIGLQLFASSTASLIAYSDADWLGCPSTRWSSTEAKYRGVANIVVEIGFGIYFGNYIRLYCLLHLSIVTISKEDDVAKISTSIFVSNFPDSVSAKDLFHSCKQYGHVVDSFIPMKRLKDGKRFGFVRFINVFNVERLVNNLCTIWLNRCKLHANIARFNRDQKNGNKYKTANQKKHEGR